MTTTTGGCIGLSTTCNKIKGFRQRKIFVRSQGTKHVSGCALRRHQQQSDLFDADEHSHARRSKSDGERALSKARVLETTRARL
jgi:hypothetical protein